MEVQQVKRPTKISFVSQRDIVEKNRSQREHILRVLDQLKVAQQEAAATVDTPQQR
ncbi:hypothetical protein PV433_10840 [Paenibacillus sp. GYB004]|uniref:hypothetical protein n=1 Tax=Paenibacillus sp. GYB004 TaxID=2994393 RepID=UPI002F966D8E